MLLKRIAKSFSIMSVVVMISVSVKTVAAESVIISSTTQATHFLELYTSQGCSSCPPAEHWIAQFTENNNLWSDIIPINFHVDYWDYLGWKDPFALATFSQRQRTYTQLGKTRIVATPGFMIDGKGWNGWFYGSAFPKANTQSENSLTARVNDTQIELDFDLNSESNLVAHAALLGFGIETQIKAGENSNRLLKHDFVVIGYQQGKMNVAEQSASVDLPLPTPVDVTTSRTALVVWVSKNNDPTPIQVAADWL